MTISSNQTRNEYTATAGQTVFSYTFKIFEDTDLNVYITPAGNTADDATDITTAYTVTDAGEAAGGTIILTVGATLNDLVTIVSNMPESRVTNYQVNGDFIPETVNNDFDRVVSLVKQATDLANRSLLFQESEQGANGLTLAAPVANKGLLWNAAGDKIITSDDDLNTLATDAAASAAAALVSEDNAAASEASAADDVVSTNADVATTNADVLLTNADVVSTNADVVSAAASAAAAQVAKIEWQGVYSGATAYAQNDAVSLSGSSFICIQAGTGNTPAVGGTAFWDDLANKGTDGVGTGDMLGANNLSDLASAATSRDNLGVEIGVDVQAHSAALDAVSGTNTGDEAAFIANDARVKTAVNAGGSAPIYACRAWVNFNGTGTVAIRGSDNVSSITDNGVGNYAVNFTTAMEDANYSASVIPSAGGRVAGGVPTTSAVFTLDTRNQVNAFVDDEFIQVMVVR